MHCAKCFFYDQDVGDETCDRCGRAYLPEANVYLGLLLLATGGAAYTLRHLLTGQMGLFIRPALDFGAWATWPVSIVDCPAYGFVIGAWVGMLAASPILTGILYGKRGGWLLCLVLAVVGPSLALAVATGVGVWVAASWRTQMGSKLASSLLGLVPVILYWFVATQRSDVETLAPALRGLVFLPPIVAVVVGVGACGLVVASGWADRWHIRWPGSLLTVLVAGPVLALLAFVGVDEVRYGLRLADHPGMLPRRVGSGSEVERLREFLAHHPSSPRSAEVRARLALRLEQLELGPDPPPGPRAGDVWRDLLRLDPDSPHAADALRHLGDADARQGLFAQAERAYRDALARTAPSAGHAADPLAEFAALWDLFSIGPRLQAKEEAEHRQALRRDLLLRLALVLENRAATPENGRALAFYFSALCRKGTNDYRQRLLAARDAEPRGALADNVEYDLAMFEAEDLRRLERLRQVATAWPGTDGAMLARLAAARGLMARASTDPAAVREARRHLDAVQADLARRADARPDDSYVAALADTVEKELVYVQAQLRAPEDPN